MNRYLLWGVLGILLSTMTLADEIIQKQYLPVDSDADGIVDDRDECYKTPVGTTVDARGCPVIVQDVKEITLNINFAFNSAVVRPEYFPEVEKVARFMKAHPLTRVTIEGHTDSDGANTYNKTLSTKRAQAVAKLLVSRYEITAVRVTAIGFGEDRPLVANDTAENKFKNRRVIAFIRSLEEKRG
jgi:OOP family OmpA-OmpF porin